MQVHCTHYVHICYIFVHVCTCVCAQSCLTSRDPTDCSPADSSARESLSRGYWRGCHFLLWGLPDPESNLHLSLLTRCQADSLALYPAPLVAQMAKRLPAVRETQVRSLGQEDPLEKEMATTPVPLPRKSQGRGSLVGHSPWGRRESDTTERLHFSFFYATWKVFYIHVYR